MRRGIGPAAVFGRRDISDLWWLVERTLKSREANALRALVGQFAQVRGEANIRSRTAIYEWQGRRVHLKTSRTDPAPEAAVLKELSGRCMGRVRPLSYVDYDEPRNVLIAGHVHGKNLVNVL